MLNSYRTGFGNNASGLVIVGDCICATGWFQPFVWLRNRMTGEERNHEEHGLSAVGMTVITPDNIIVIADSTKKLHFVTIDPQNMVIRSRQVRDVSFEPRQVHFDPVKRKLFVCKKGRESCAVVVLDENGRPTQEGEITLPPNIEMRCPLPTEDGFVVLDYGKRGRVLWMNRDGAVTHVYGERDGERLTYPMHMQRDKRGRLFIADCWSNKLHVIDTDKTLEKYMLEDVADVQRPTCVFVDEVKKQLLVAHWDLRDASLISEVAFLM